MKGLPKMNIKKSEHSTSLLLDKIKLKLTKNLDDLSELMAKECLYEKNDCRALILESFSFIDNLPDIIKMHQGILKTENECISQLVSNEANIRHDPYGRVLLILPSNAPLPLAIVLPLAFGIAGNSVIVAGSSRTKKTVGRALEIFEDTSLDVVLWKGTAKNAVEDLVKKSKVDLCYFTGSSKLFPELSELCARSNVHLIFEGEGNGNVIIDTDETEETLTLIATMLIESCRFCLGKMCSKPTAIFVPEDNYNFFFKTISNLAKEVSLSCSTIDVLSREDIQRIHSLSGAGLEIDFNKKNPVFLGTRNTIEAIKTEIYGPAAFVVPYSAQSEVLDLAENTPYKMQISIFSSKGGTLSQKIKSYGFARACINIQPIAQNVNLPWGCYGLSGCSDVLDFYRKGLKRTLVETMILRDI